MSVHTLSVCALGFFFVVEFLSSLSVVMAWLLFTQQRDKAIKRYEWKWFRCMSEWEGWIYDRESANVKMGEFRPKKKKRSVQTPIERWMIREIPVDGYNAVSMEIQTKDKADHANGISIIHWKLFTQKKSGQGSACWSLIFIHLPVRRSVLIA